MMGFSSSSAKRASIILFAPLLLTGCAEYIIAEAAVNAAYHGTKAIVDYTKSKSDSGSTKATSSKITCAYPDGKIYQTLTAQCRANDGVIVETDGKTKFGCRKSDGTRFASTYSGCQARSGWIDNSITVRCEAKSGYEIEKSAFECLSIGYNVTGMPRKLTAEASLASDSGNGRCKLKGSGFITVDRNVCLDMAGDWVAGE